MRWLLLALLIAGCSPAQKAWSDCENELGGPPGAGWSALGPLGIAVQSSSSDYHAWGQAMDACRARKVAGQ